MAENVGESFRRYAHRYWPLFVDMIFAVLALGLAFEVRFDGNFPAEYLSSAWIYGIMIIALVRGLVN